MIALFTLKGFRLECPERPIRLLDDGRDTEASLPRYIEGFIPPIQIGIVDPTGPGLASPKHFRLIGHRLVECRPPSAKKE